MGWDLPIAVVAAATVAAGCQPGANARDGGAVAAGARLSPPADAVIVSDAASAASDTGLSAAHHAAELEAVVTPPIGWRPDPLKRSHNHAHQAWISPTGRTAYGVIRINLPLPLIGPDLVLPRFLREMRQSEGEARLLGRRNDPDLPGIRFLAEGGQYRLRANLITRGFRAWAVYAGTLRAQPEEPRELEVAEAAREQTRIGATRIRSKNR